MPSDSIMDCSGVIEERSTGALTADEPNGDGRIVITHRLRFSVLERAEGGRVSGVAWTETEELGGIVEQPVTSEDYLRRVQRVLTAVVARLRDKSRRRGPAATRASRPGTWPRTFAPSAIAMQTWRA